MLAMLTRAIFLACILMVAISLAGCAGDKADREPATPIAVRQTITIYGPPGFKQVLTPLKALLAITGPPYEFKMWDGASTEAGIQGIVDGTFDVMILMRRPLPEEPVAYTAFFLTPVAIFAHPEVGLTQLTREQAAAIFSGEVTNWQELGGPDQSIAVFVQKYDDSMTEVIREEILDGRPFVESAHVLPAEKSVFSVVEGVPGAISYAAWGGKRFWEYVSGTQYLDAVAVDGFLPVDPDYPVMSMIGAAYLPERQITLQPLFDWINALIESGAVQGLLDQLGIRPVNAASISSP